MSEQGEKGDKLTLMYFCQLCYCLKLNAHDSEGIPSTNWNYRGVWNPIAFNEGQAARLVDHVFPLACPSWMSTTDITNDASSVPIRTHRGVHLGQRPNPPHFDFISNLIPTCHQRLKPSGEGSSRPCRRRGRCRA